MTPFGKLMVEAILALCIGYAFGIGPGLAFGLGCTVECVLEWMRL